MPARSNSQFKKMAAAAKYEQMTRTQLLNAVCVELFYNTFQNLLVATAELKQSLVHLRRLRDVTKSTQNYLELSAAELRQLHIERQNLRKICYQNLPAKMAFFTAQRRQFEQSVDERLREISKELGQDYENQTPFPENFIWQQIQPDAVYLIEEICAEAPSQVLKEFGAQMKASGQDLGNFGPIVDAATRSVCVCPTDEVLNSLERFGSRLKDSVLQNSLRGSQVRSVNMK